MSCRSGIETNGTTTTEAVDDRGCRRPRLDGRRIIGGPWMGSTPRATDPIAASDLDPRSVYEIDRARVARSGLLIAYAGTPSFGVGIEVEIAREHGIPVILVAERDRTVSRILLGSPAVVDTVRFNDLAALRHSLGEAIARATKI